MQCAIQIHTLAHIYLDGGISALFFVPLWAVHNNFVDGKGVMSGIHSSDSLLDKTMVDSLLSNWSVTVSLACHITRRSAVG